MNILYHNNYFKLNEFLKFFLIIIIILSRVSIYSQCYTTAGNTIEFQTSNHNSDLLYEDIFLLTDYRNVILATSLSNNFPGQVAGLYNIYAINYLISEIPLLPIGENINSIIGSCLDISGPLEILVCPDENDCNTFVGSYQFNAQGENINYLTRYILTDSNKQIVQISEMNSFENIDLGVFMIFAINYELAINLEVGFNLDDVVFDCVDFSNPLVIRSCENCMTFLGDDIELCGPQSIILTASGGLNGFYLWNTGQMSPSITVFPTETTTYTVTFFADNGCQAFDEVTIFVNAIPVADAGNDRVICSGETVELAAELIPGATYQWSNGATTRVITVNPIVTQNYTVTVTLNDCSSVDMVNISVNACSSISGKIWEDLNANGINEVGEPAIGNFLVQLLDSGGNQYDFTYADENGDYIFNNVPSGGYFVLFSKPLEYQLTIANAGSDDTIDSDADVDTGQTILLNFNGIDPLENIDAGYYQFANVGDFVWEDANKNGLQDVDEEGIADVEVSLSGTDGTGMAVFLQTATNEDGLYSFEDLVPGNYFLTFMRPSLDYKSSPKNVDLDDDIDSDADELDGTTHVFPLLSGQTERSIDAGFYKCAIVGDFVWLDLGDIPNVQDAGDIGLDGVIVNLYSNLNPTQIIHTVTSSPNNGLAGFYSFEVCDVGEYFISVEIDDAYNFVLGGQGGDENLDSDIVDYFSGASAVFEVPYGAVIDFIDVGLQFKPLPINLIEFSGIRNVEKGQNELFWSTSIEVNTDYFQIERSINGSDFVTIGKVKAAGNSDGLKLYTLYDKDIHIFGLYEYVLKSWDLDGKESYRKSIFLNIENHHVFNATLYPNPTHGESFLEILALENSEIRISVTDIVGKNLYYFEYSNPINNVDTIIELPSNQWANGVYIIKINIDNQVFSKKLIIQK